MIINLILFTRCAHEAKSEDMTGEATLLDLRREYHCAAYNLLVSVVSCTQTDAKFYAVFLFGENEAKVFYDKYFNWKE